MQGTGDARYLGARLIPVRDDSPSEQMAQVRRLSVTQNSAAAQHFPLHWCGCQPGVISVVFSCDDAC